ncbi:hypothetical protein ABIQ69_01325 [Agromyces sp. G08B096]|uniref:Uncharacterized protein n=1 Tax=Agromyces sp. G08B096 TaxID=3156399 RepID=A0AAU7W7Y5_9MICO
MIRRPGTRRGQGLLARIALPAVLVAALAGCASDPRLSADETVALHERVLDVAERSTGGDYAGAMAELALLEADVAEASAAGSLPDEQEADITEAIALVRTDLETLIAEQSAPAPAEDAGDDGEDANDDGGNGDDGGGNGDEGNQGKGGDKGKGKGKD